jgi:hypothetical protein
MEQFSMVIYNLPFYMARYFFSLLSAKKNMGTQMISYTIYRLRSNVTPGILSVCLHLKFYTGLPVL